MSNKTLTKIELLEKLNKTNLMLIDILKNAQETDLLNEAQYKLLNATLDQNKEYQHRLEKENFEIAIIGTEKAGKSTFTNALIKSTFLPSAIERCTFTSTTIEYGENEEATIEIYSEEEFNTIFKDLLASIHYPEEKIPEDFRTLSLDEFKKFIGDNHSSSYEKDICSILEEKDYFELSGKIIHITKKENADFNEIIKQYIIGEPNEKGQKITAKPRSVKSIKIKTQNLSALKNAVIYDIPGFDSPILEHKKQSEKYLNQADVVIFVTDATKPSFTAPVYDILSYKGKNNLLLKDKMFIFGNKKDKANNLSDAEKIDKELLIEIEKFKFNPENLVTGSALRSLKEYGLYNDELVGLEIAGNIDVIRDKIIEFNRSKQVENIAARFNENNQKIKDVLNHIIQKNRSLLNSNDDELRYKLNKDIEDLIRETLNEVINEIREEFNESKTLTKEFSRSIDDNITLQPIDLESVKKLSNTRSITNELQFGKINSEVRENKFYSILQNFSDNLQKLSVSKIQLVKERILNALLLKLKQENNSLDCAVLKTLLDELITPFDIENSAHNQFEVLFDRYSRHVFDIFLYPLADSTRAQKFNNTKADFLYLDYQYSLNSVPKSKSYTLINLLLTQEEGKLYEAILKRTHQLIDEFVDNYSRHNTILKSAETIKTGFNWVKNKVTKKEESVNEVTDNSESSKSSLIDTLFSENSIFDIDIDKYISVPKAASSLEEIVKEINTDMANIKKILRDAVSPAMGLETVFLNSMDKKITESIYILTNASNVNKITNAIIGDLNTFKEKQNIKLNKLKQIDELKLFLEC